MNIKVLNTCLNESCNATFSMNQFNLKKSLFHDTSILTSFVGFSYVCNSNQRFQNGNQPSYDEYQNKKRKHKQIFFLSLFLFFSLSRSLPRLCFVSNTFCGAL